MQHAFLRLSAWALLFGGLFVILNDLTHLGFLRLEGTDDLSIVAKDPIFLGHGGTHIVYGILVMLGLAGIAVRYGDRLGTVGLGVTVFAFIGQALMLSMYAAFTLGASAAPDTFLGDEGPGGLFNLFAPIALFSGVGGLALMGIVLAWRKVLSRSAGIVLAIASPAFILVPIPAGFEALMGLAIAWLGFRFVQEVGGPVVASAEPIATAA